MSGTEQGNTRVKNILILEDEPAALRYLVKIVEDCSPLEYCVFGYTGLKEAYECMKHRTISLFMVDIMLDQKKCNREGYRFIEEIRKSEEYRHVPVIFVTGLEEPRAQAYKDLHCFGYIQKPYDVNEIHRMVKKCLTYNPVEVKARLHLKNDGIHVLFDTDQVVYVRITGKNLSVKVHGKPLAQYAYLTMKEIMEQLKSEPMIMCGKGLLVNGKYMDYLDQKERKLYLKDEAEPLKLTRAGLKENIHSITDGLSR